jgi:hypothetical protein
MALCAGCEVLGQELAETYPPENLKFLSARQIVQRQRIVGSIERYMCRTCGARWIRDLRPTAKGFTWMQSVVRQGNIAPESRARSAWNIPGKGA